MCFCEEFFPIFSKMGFFNLDYYKSILLQEYNPTFDEISRFCTSLCQISSLPIECLSTDYYEHQEKRIYPLPEPLVTVFQVHQRWVCCMHDVSGQVTLYNASLRVRRTEVWSFLAGAYKVNDLKMYYTLTGDADSALSALVQTTMLAMGRQVGVFSFRPNKIRRNILRVLLLEDAASFVEMVDQITDDEST